MIKPALVLLSDNDTDAPTLPAVATVSKNHAHPGWDNGAWDLGVAATRSGRLWVDRPYWTGAGDVPALVQRCRTITALGGFCQAGNEQNLPLEQYPGGPAQWRVFWNLLNTAYPAGHWLAMPPSPGVPGWQQWVTVDAKRLAIHCYGSFDEMRAIVAWYLANTAGDLYITECNFAPPRKVERDVWATNHLKPFLDWCSTHPRIKMVAYFAWRWDQSPTLPTPVDAASTQITHTLRTWQPPQEQEPPVSLEDRAFAEMTKVQLAITPSFALPSAIIRENQRLGDNYRGFDIVTPEHRFEYNGRRYAMMGAQRITDEAKMVAVAPDGNWSAVQVFTRGISITPPLVIKPAKSPNWHPRPAGTRIDTIVLHHTGGSLSSTLNWFADPASESSAHYVIDHDGTIYQPVAEENAAWHVGKSRLPDGREWLNNFSLGYELVNKGDGKDPYPAAQQAALRELLRLHRDRYGIAASGVVAHGDVRARWNQAHPDNKGDFRNDPLGLDWPAIVSQVWGNA